jgi:hypothetical protein
VCRYNYLADGMESLKQDMIQLEAAISAHRRSLPHRLFWRECTAQHFDTPSGADLQPPLFEPFFVECLVPGLWDAPPPPDQDSGIGYRKSASFTGDAGALASIICPIFGDNVGLCWITNCRLVAFM